MKYALKKSPIPYTQLFVAQRLQQKHFDPIWHSHAECQLFLVIKSAGTRFIGDNISSFKPGELIMTGPNLPHLWRNEQQYFGKRSTLKAEGIVLYLKETLWGGGMLDTMEMSRVKLLFQKSRRGLEFIGPNKMAVTSLMKKIADQDGVKKVITLMEILDLLSTTRDYRYISSKNYTPNIDDHEGQRMNTVLEYIFSNYRSRISLNLMAERLFMTPTSFSRYFARKNNKTFSRFVSEVRLKHACELLVNTELSIAEICYESGFNTLSNFNKQFKEVIGMKPKEYKMGFLTV